MENVELAKLIVKQIETEPGSFDMQVYARLLPCGTVACLAGHAMLLSGYTFAGSGFCRPDGTPVVVGCQEKEAAWLLGLSAAEFHCQSDGNPGLRLFSQARSNADALALFKQLIAAAEQET